MDHDLIEIKITLATLGTKLDALIVAMTAQHVDHEARIRILERGWYKVVGAATILGAGGGSIMSFLLGGI